MRADQQRSILGTASAQRPQKAAEPPHKCPHAASDSAEGLAAPYFCGTSRAFCGAHPDNHNTPGQQPSSRLSADSAVSATDRHTSRAERSTVQHVLSNRDHADIDPTLALLTVEEAARRLGIGRTVCYRLISAGELESVTVGRLRRVPADAVPEYVSRLRASSRPLVQSAA
ncbi:helix-turn-helix domain-containing protein [Streptomyces sp. GKU 257-1]|nr:helix-turn-helix domain-containing protein [Streptomyces sp. GKU 257-1]